jgi:predicted component of type VI protein secretion system
MDRRAGRPGLRDRPPAAGDRGAAAGAAGRRGDLVRGADLRAGQRLCVSPYKDYGAQAKLGDPLADIDTPDSISSSSRPRRISTRPSPTQLADVTAKLWKALLTSASVSQQSVDEKAADAMAQRAAQ